MAKVTKNGKQIRYLNQLLKIELGQNVDKNVSSIHNTAIRNQIAASIDNIVNLRKEDNRYVIQFPKEVENEIEDKNLLKMITREITASEILLIVAMVSLAQEANAAGRLDIWESGKKALLKVTLSEIYKAMGLGESYGKKERDLVKKTLNDISFKKYLLSDNGKYYSDHLITIHKPKMVNSSLMEIEISTLLFDTTKPVYFNIPQNFNIRIKEAYKAIGRKSRQNPDTILFIKHLYQAKHMAKKNGLYFVEYNYEKVSDLLRIDNLIKNKNHSRIKPLINKTFEIAKQMELINKIEEVEYKGKVSKYKFHFCE
ncbi:hypothetical protein [Chondrinema litorale]|uniref:hypothetical protein n=1 Tax=Chondrinema litorale TaxID=2994555 RepID=UPI002543B32A|nr:hypothetical protein [Chondrinema litorale]UZR99624.1 hypothetical protein OQ292_37175 [Chondrinema litorale]